MKRDDEIQLIERALRCVEERSPDRAERTQSVPAAWYVDERRAAAERASVFRELPLVAGFSSQVARPGDFVTRDMGDVPVLVIRGGDGALRAFVNACRHRGTLLEPAACGAGRQRFACPYHGWTYDDRGALRAVPHAGEFPGLDRATRGLVPLPVGERHGLVFVVPDPGAGGALDLPDLDETLGPLARDLDGFGLAGHVHHRLSTRSRACNWKLVVDGSLEAYHFRTTHAETIYHRFFDNTAVADWAGRGARAVLPKRSITGLVGADRDAWQLRPHVHIVYLLFPNTLVLLLSDHAMVFSVWPDGVDRTTLCGGLLIPEEPADDAIAAHWQRNEALFWQVLDEDLAMAERIQRTLRSGASRQLVLGGHEFLIGRFHGAVDEVIAASDSLF